MFYGQEEDRRCAACKMGDKFEQYRRLEFRRYKNTCSKCARARTPKSIFQASEQTMEEVREFYLRSIEPPCKPERYLLNLGEKKKPAAGNPPVKIGPIGKPPAPAPKPQPIPTSPVKLRQIVKPLPPTPIPIEPIIPVTLNTPPPDIAQTIPSTPVKISPVVESLPPVPIIQSVATSRMKPITPITSTAPILRASRKKPSRMNECVQTPMVELISEACQTNPVKVYYNIAEESEDAEDVVITAREEKPVAAREKAAKEIAENKDEKAIGGEEKYKQVINERNEIIKYLSEVKGNKNIRNSESEEANVESSEEVQIVFPPTVSEKSSIEAFLVKEVKIKECNKLHMKPMFDYLGYFAILVVVVYIVYYNSRKTYNHIMLGVEELGESGSNEDPTFISDCWKIVSNITYHLCAKWIDLIAS